MFEVEATLIDAYPGLANQQGGHGSRDRGPMHITEINNKYDLPVFPGAPSHSLVLINVNAIEDQTSPAGILRQVRYAWRIDTNRAAKADFVVAVYRGIAIGIFKAEQWLPATADNFPEFNHDIEGRCGFHGQVADEEIWREYIGDHGKRIEEKSLLHIQNPIRYWNC